MFWFFPWSCLLFSSLSNLFKVVQRARPSFNPKGTCPRWAESPAAPSETKLCTQQFHSTREGGGDRNRRSVIALTQLHLMFALARTSKCFFGFCVNFGFLCELRFFLVLPCNFPPCFLTFLRSCNGHAPLLIQKGRAPARQKVQPLRVRQNAALDSSIVLRKGRKNV
jgi:hypothetical protein